MSALAVAISVAAGAFGAHGLEARITPDALETWETGARYLAYAGLASWLIGLTAGRRPGGSDPRRRVSLLRSGLLVLFGGALFFATLAVLALGGPRFFGAITPIGGASMIGGLLWFLVVGWAE